MYEVIYPKSDILKKYIVSYNILKQTNSDTINYHAFPQLGTTIAFLNNANIIFENEKLEFSSKKNCIQALFFGKYLSPINIKYHNFVNEISVNFTAVGVNYFFKNYFTDIAPNNIQVFSNKESNLIPEKLFQYENDEIINHLETFLLLRFKHIDIYPIEQAVDLIQQDTSIKTIDLAKKVCLTEKTLSRNFKKIVGCKITVFKKIYKFRSAIQDKFKNNSTKNLTQLCFDNNFYDSPHFCREFKRIASINPKDFFNKVSSVGLDAYPYIFH